MAKVEYQCQFTINGYCFQSVAVTSSNFYFKQKRFAGAFNVSYKNELSTICFCLDEPKGDESYQLEITKLDPASETDNPEDIINIVNTNQPMASFQYSAGTYILKCTVTFATALGLTRHDPMTSFIDFCKKDPGMLLTFKIGDAEVKAITSIMCSNSDVIDAMMKSQCIEAETKVVKIEDFSADVIQKMVEFCESNHIKDTEGFELEICKVANKYNIEPLRHFGAGLVTKLLSKENLIEMFQFSQTYNNTELGKNCIECANANLVEVVKSSDYAKVDSEPVKDFWIAVKEYGKTA